MTQVQAKTYDVLLDQANFDIQTAELLVALDRRNVQSVGDLERYDQMSLDLLRLRAGVHKWFCTGSDRSHAGTDKRPHIGWACERGARVIAETYAADPQRTVPA